MPLEKPDSEDIRKINAEVNQIVHQRFLLVTLAITVFGAISTWIIPKQLSKAESLMGTLAFVESALLSLILFMLFYYSCRLKAHLRVLTSYLIEVGASDWEKAWRNYRKDPYSAYTEIHALLFMGLTFFAVMMPFFVVFSFGLPIGLVAAAICTAIELAILAAMYFIGFRGWLDNELNAAERWKALNK